MFHGPYSLYYSLVMTLVESTVKRGNRSRALKSAALCPPIFTMSMSFDSINWMTSKKLSESSIGRTSKSGVEQQFEF